MSSGRWSSVILLTAAAALSACGTTVPNGGFPAAAGPGAAAAGGGELGTGPAAPGQLTDPLTGQPLAAGDSGTAVGPGGVGTAPGGAVTGPGSAPGSAAGPEAASGSTGGGSRTGPAAPRGARVTAPISVGFIVEQGDGQQANQAAGIDTGQTVTIGKLYRALVAELNKAGGLSGRKITPVYHAVNAAAPSYDAELASACAAFTQDNRVAAVLDTIGGEQAYEQCLAKGGAFHVSGSGGSSDERSLAQVPSLYVAAPSIERRERSRVTSLAANGLLKRGTKVGVIVDECPDTRIGFERAFKPAADKAGLVLERVDSTCASGFDDLGAIGAAMQNAVLRFQSAGVTVVSFVSNIAPTEVILFTQAAENQNYRPGYAIGSDAQPIALAGNLPPGQLRGMRGIGWLPSLDVAIPKLPPRQAPQNRCLALLKAQGVVPASSADFYLSFTACENVFSLERLLKDSAGVSDRGTLLQAARALGTSYAPVVTFESRFSAEGLDGPTTGRTFRYTEACGCFEYDSGPVPLR